MEPPAYHQPVRARENHMSAKTDELILKTAKEIVVKFIEVGNISPASFHDHFRNIYKTVEASVQETAKKADAVKK
jgi:hypothetical protein